ncbi:lactose transport system permease protein LacF [Oxobacter pfennigii]|uniref:Lactose transport system permease protein LacF n=1 Tax=Oxobacter pfennigii TaxID=36849 RepID=A0A0P8X5L9_9CLOT|nr:sugar ABC transporter permease [Oxobacter pfennigii]KPU46148.1 lactose transport system permease protein LacF [Oxobacter pfennigii]
MKKIFKINGNKLAWFFLAPSIIGFSVFYAVPFLGGLYYSLVSSPINGEFVGLQNYFNLIKNPSFIKAVINTAMFSFISVPLNMILSLCLALLINANTYGRNIFRTLFITPLVVPVASVVLVWQSLFDINGVLNGLITSLGQHPVDWMKTEWARAAVIIVYLWKNIGYSMVLFLSGLKNIPVEYYESAKIDGANSWKQFTNITMVYLTPTAFFVFIMSIINSFKVFRETYLISGDHPHSSIYMLQHYMNNMFASLDYQKLTSAAFVMAVFIVLIVFILFVIERKINRMVS